MHADVHSPIQAGEALAARARITLTSFAEAMSDSVNDALQTTASR